MNMDTIHKTNCHYNYWLNAVSYELPKQNKFKLFENYSLAACLATLLLVNFALLFLLQVLQGLNQ